MMTDPHETNDVVRSRRRLLAAGAATTGVAYVAPQVLGTAVAGAMTATIHVFKLSLGGGCSTAGLVAGPSDTDCDAAFNSALSSDVAAAGGTVVIGCPPAGSISSNLNVTSGDVSLGANCTLVFLGVGTASGTCHPPGSAGDPVLIDADEKGGCYVLPEGETFGFLTVAIRCVGSP